MTARRNRLLVALGRAESVANHALARWSAASQRINELDRRRESALEKAGHLASEGLPSGLRGHLSAVGALHLVALADQKVEAIERADLLRREYDAARSRLRSLERLVERLEVAEALRVRRQVLADERDLVSTRTSRGRP